MMKSNFLESIERGLKVLDIDFQDDSWRYALPSCPGWYFIETNTPLERFFDVGKPKGERHYNIPEKVEASLTLEKIEASIIRPSGNFFYFVYSGESKNLKARAREHVWGHEKTGCLALGNYPLLHVYKWKFHFAPCLFGSHPNESKLVRIFGEQLWRAKYGWPILCGK